MASDVNVLKIQIPATRPVPRHANRIGEVFARFLVDSGKVLANAGHAAHPGVIRAELLQSAAGVEAQRPGAALSLRSVAAKGWVC